MEYTMRGKRRQGGTTYWTKSAVARELGVGIRQWEHLIQRNKVIAPKEPIGKRFYYRESQVPSLRRAIETYRDRIAAKNAGWSSFALAKEIGLAHQVFQHHVKQRRFPSPAFGIRYTTEEARKIKEIWDYYQQVKKTHWNLLPGLTAVGCTEKEIYWFYSYTDRKAELLADIPAVTFSERKKDRYYSRQSLAKIRDRIRLRRNAARRIRGS
jgi:hypothetical protein